MQSKAVEAPVPAVVVRGEVNGLGVVRSLAQDGVPAIVVDTTLRHAAMWSRWSKRNLVGQLSGRPFVDDLLTLQKHLGVRPVLILTDEMSVHTISDYRAELAPYYRFRLPSPAMVATLCNKALFQDFAQTHDLPVPRAIVLERESAIARIPELGLPVIVKPADKRPVHLGQVERINWLDRAEDAAAACRRMLNCGGTLVVQEWIEGPDSSIYFALFHCGAEGASRKIFFGRKLAAHPAGLGSTAVCVPAPEATESLQPLTERFLEISQYQGLGSLEFKWDARARRFVIIEPTVGRTDWQEEIATLNGVNLALIAYCSELGLPTPAPRPVAPAAWRESFLHLGCTARLSMRTYDGYWRVEDPLPALAFCIDLACRSAHRLFTQPMLERRKPPFRRRRIAKRGA
jgi:predicted ATP-grasp superfamily ATP-dependent carboligase